jgi:hypothetical protein
MYAGFSRFWAYKPLTVRKVAIAIRNLSLVFFISLVSGTRSTTVTYWADPTYRV